MRNPRITKKDMDLIKGALRRVFSRSDLRRSVIDAAKVEHSDPTRPRVKTWCRCADCGELEAKSNIVVDHIKPVIRIKETLHDLTVEQLVDRIWCEVENLQALDERCHKAKSKIENSARRKYKKSLQNTSQ